MEEILNNLMNKAIDSMTDVQDYVAKIIVRKLNQQMVERSGDTWNIIIIFCKIFTAQAFFYAGLLQFKEARAAAAMCLAVRKRKTRRIWTRRRTRKSEAVVKAGRAVLEKVWAGLEGCC